VHFLVLVLEFQHSQGALFLVVVLVVVLESDRA
jgi:hypothetical protein